MRLFSVLILCLLTVGCESLPTFAVNSHQSSVIWSEADAAVIRDQLTGQSTKIDQAVDLTAETMNLVASLKETIQTVVCVVEELKSRIPEPPLVPIDESVSAVSPESNYEEAVTEDEPAVATVVPFDFATTEQVRAMIEEALEHHECKCRQVSSEKAVSSGNATFSVPILTQQTNATSTKVICSDGVCRPVYTTVRPTSRRFFGKKFFQ